MTDHIPANGTHSMHGSRKFCQGVPTFSFLDEGRERIQIPQERGHHRPVSETAFKWRFSGGPMMAQH